MREKINRKLVHDGRSWLAIDQLVIPGTLEVTTFDQDILTELCMIGQGDPTSDSKPELITESAKYPSIIITIN